MADKFRNRYRIPPNRWAYWDYSRPGSYFITICTHGRAHLFGEIAKRKMILSPFGQIVEDEFREMATYHPRAILDVHVVMPNHVHCILTLGDYDFDNGLCAAPAAGDGGAGDIAAGGTGTGIGTGTGSVEKIHEFSLPSTPSTPPTPPIPWWHDPDHDPSPDDIKAYRKYRRRMIIPKIMGKFQMQTSKKINILRDTPATPNWQANYHDHVIRNRASFKCIKRYIIQNPEKWQNDQFFNGG
jgi:REP element-mobilizing transposase RayT